MGTAVSPAWPSGRPEGAVRCLHRACTARCQASSPRSWPRRRARARRCAERALRWYEVVARHRSVLHDRRLRAGPLSAGHRRPCRRARGVRPRAAVVELARRRADRQDRSPRRRAYEARRGRRRTCARPRRRWSRSVSIPSGAPGSTHQDPAGGAVGRAAGRRVAGTGRRAARRRPRRARPACGHRALLPDHRARDRGHRPSASASSTWPMTSGRGRGHDRHRGAALHGVSGAGAGRRQVLRGAAAQRSTCRPSASRPSASRSTWPSQQRSANRVARTRATRSLPYRARGRGRRGGGDLRRHLHRGIGRRGGAGGRSRRGRRSRRGAAQRGRPRSGDARRGPRRPRRRAGGPGDDARTLAPPSCTLVSAACRNATLVVGWIGDSRAYWLAADETRGSSRSTTHGRRSRSRKGCPRTQAFADRRAHAITRWVGADSPVDAPQVTTLAPSHAGRLVLCTDGLWNAAPAPGMLATLVEGVDADATPASVAHLLADAALTAGTRDDVTVAVIDINGRRRAAAMTRFTADVYQNEFLALGATDVDAVVTVTAADAAPWRRRRRSPRQRSSIVDASGSMVSPPGSSRPPSRRPGRPSTRSAMAWRSA